MAAGSLIFDPLFRENCCALSLDLISAGIIVLLCSQLPLTCNWETYPIYCTVQEVRSAGPVQPAEEALGRAAAAPPRLPLRAAGRRTARGQDRRPLLFLRQPPGGASCGPDARQPDPQSQRHPGLLRRQRGESERANFTIPTRRSHF